MTSTPPLRFHLVAQPLAALSGAAASVAMAVLLIMLRGDLTEFIAGNLVEDRFRKLLMVVPASVAMLVMFGGFVAAVLYRERALVRLQRIAGFCAPLLLLWAVPVLASYRVWRDHTLEFLLLLTLFGLALEQTFRWFFRSLPPNWFERFQQATKRFETGRARYLPLALVVLGCAGYAAYISHFTILEHHRMTTGTFDLGIHDNLMANALAGKFFRVPALLPDESSMLRGHALFGMFLYLPFYAIKPSSETLLIIQAVMLGFAALPLYLFASTQMRRVFACILAYCYLLAPTLHGPNFYDFHFFPTAMFFHFWLYYALAKKNPWLTGIVWLCLVAMREDVSIGLILLGVLLALSGVRVTYGLAIAVGSFIAFVTIKFVIMPAAGTWFFADLYKELQIPGESSYGSVIVTILTNPTRLLMTLVREHKLIFVLHVFAPLLFLSWRNPWLLLAALGGFPSTLMVTGYVYQTDIGFQYVTHMLPYVFGGAAISLRLLGKDCWGSPKVSAAALAMLATMLLHSLVFGAVLQRNTFHAAAKDIPMRMTDAEAADYQALVELRALIPRDAVVAADPQTYPHISNRANAYDLESAHANAEYFLITPRAVRKAHRTLAPLLREARYGLVAKKGTVYLFKRGLESKGSRQAWAELGLDYQE